MGRTSDARERLVASAAGLMHDRGYTAVGVGEICAGAGVNKGSFYHFFPSKQELALAVIEAFENESRPAFQELREGAGSPLARLEGFLAGAVASQRDSHRACGKRLGCPVGNLALELSTQDPLLRDRLRGVFEAHADALQVVLEQAVEAGELPPIPVEVTARTIFGMLEGALMMMKMSDDLAPLEELPGQVRRLLRGSAAAA